MSAKQRYPRADALAVVRELLAVLQPLAERVVIAGSLRRRKADVGDIEMLYIPKVCDAADPQSLFGETKPTNVFDAMLVQLVADGVISRRLNSLDREAWGPSNKLGVHVASGIPVDFFSATPENWWNYLVCRTGGAESNTTIASEAKARGWKWNPYGAGFTRQRPGLARPEERPMHSEEEVFAFVGLRFAQPWERK